jgi:uncharacterized protein (TIGR00251 family)
VTAKPYGAVPGGVRLAVRLTPRAGRDALDGTGVDAQGRPVLLVRLAAPPVEGAANEALVAFLADLLDLRRKDVTIRSGQTSRTKIVSLAGDPDALLMRLSRVI